MSYWTVTGNKIENIKTELSSVIIERHEARMIRAKRIKEGKNRQMPAGATGL
tara:strand:+ start:72 stop:227 length:156 start_codon:yes stop_codon:yes gene_type:complete